MIVFTTVGERLRLGREVGRGGEALVYEVEGRPDVIAKVYARERPDYRRKLTYMRSMPPTDPSLAIGHASIAWPRHLLQDERGRFKGYLMAHIREAVPLLSVFNPRRRAHVLPGFNPAYLHRAARNLSSALAALHARDYIVGDLNERNVLVTPRALVTIIDTDSFQVQELHESRIVVYPCPVGRSEYTPPELQGRAFKGVVRRPDHDVFGLAVLVYQLLRRGNHPFRSQWLGDGDPPPVEQRIARGWFPLWEGAPPEIGPAPDVPPLEILFPGLEELFVRCFVEGHERPGLRPSAEEWSRALGEAEQHLTECKNGHHYSDHLSRCPSCGAKASGRPARRPPHGRARGGAVTPQAGSAAPVPAGTPSSTAAMQSAPFAGPIGHAFSLLLTPVRAVSQAGDQLTLGLRRAYATTMGRVSALPRRAAGAAVRSILDPRKTGASLRRLQRQVAWTSLLAILAAALGVGGGVALSLGFYASLVPLARALSGSGATPAGLWSLLVGASAMGVVGAFRVLAASPTRRPTPEVALVALSLAASGVVGWIAGWLLPSLVIGVVGGESLLLAAFGRIAGSTGQGTAGEAAGWTLGWALYGAVAGALSGTVREDRAGWAAAGAVFGAAGWAVMRIISSA